MDHRGSELTLDDDIGFGESGFRVTLLKAKMRRDVADLVGSLAGKQDGLAGPNR